MTYTCPYFSPEVMLKLRRRVKAEGTIRDAY